MSWGWAKAHAIAHDESSAIVPKAFVNEHLSVSRLKLMEQCPRSFKRKYIDGIKSKYGDAALFGVVLHAALERTYEWVKSTEYAGPIPEAQLLGFYQEEWARAEMIGVALYQEGLDILRLYVRRFPPVDHREIVAIEEEFNIEIDGFKMNGYIDRVDKIASDWIAIVDYKSNRLLFSQEELDNDLQMSIYGLAAREKWPWAKRVSFVFHMLRHGVPQATERTAEQIDDHRAYVVQLGKRTESAAEQFKPLLNAFCGYCDHRVGCDEYEAAIRGDYDFVKVTDPAKFEEIARTRELVHKVAKAAYKRKADLDDIIKAKLKAESVDEIIAAGTTYRMIDTFSNVYPAQKVVKAFRDLGVEESKLEKLARVSATDVEELLAKVLEDPSYDRTKKIMLRAKVESLADRVPSSPKIDARPFKNRDSGDASKGRRASK